MTNQEIIIKNDESLNYTGSLQGYTLNFLTNVDSCKFKTIQSYKVNLKNFFEYLQDRNVMNPEYEDLLSWKRYLVDGNHKESTIHAYINTIKQFFKWTEANQLYPNIARNLKNVALSNIHRKDSLSIDQVKEVLSLFKGKNDIESRRDFAIIFLEVNCGFRACEVANMNIEDFQYRNGEAVIYYQAKGSIGKDKMKPISYQVEKAIRSYLALRPETNPDSPLFTSISDRNQGGRLTTRSLSRIVKNSFLKCGLNSDRLSQHSLRHTTAMTILRTGGNIHQVQAVLGHKKITTSEIYLDEFNLLEDDSIQKLGQVFEEA